MKKNQLQGCLTWAVIFSFVFAVTLGIFFAVKPDTVYAIQNFINVVSTFARVEREIMSPTPYGRYYSGLYFKNHQELIQILSSHPEYKEDMYKLMYLYIPHIDAALDGRGDEVHITQSQVDELQAFFDQIQAASNGELRVDIERELARTPLQDFVGMSMDETLAYIEYTWKRDFGSFPSPTGTNWETQTVTRLPLITGNQLGVLPSGD